MACQRATLQGYHQRPSQIFVAPQYLQISSVKFLPISLNTYRKFDVWEVFAYTCHSIRPGALWHVYQAFAMCLLALK